MINRQRQLLNFKCFRFGQTNANVADIAELAKVIAGGIENEEISDREDMEEYIVRASIVALYNAPSDEIELYDANGSFLYEDILKLDINKLVEEENDGKPIKVVANLPYYITTPLIMKFLESGLDLESVTVMIQKEVAERISSPYGNKTYGILSVFLQTFRCQKHRQTIPLR